MSGTLGMVLMICSPFIAAGVMLAILKGCERYAAWRYQRAVEKRNAQQELYGIKPFRGTKEWRPEEWLR
jgi:hypothetical protein